MKCDVNIFGMLAGHDDVIHADAHGAVVIPAEAVRVLPKAIEAFCRDAKKVILDRARAPGLHEPRDAGRAARDPRNPLIAGRRSQRALPGAFCDEAQRSEALVLSGDVGPVPGRRDQQVVEGHTRDGRQAI